MNIKVAITNLGAYNEGRLLFDWLELPLTDEDLKIALDNIEIDGERYEEYIISDYEAPFEIGEYTSLTKLNELAEEMEDVEIPNDELGYAIEDVMNFAQELEDIGVIRDSMEFIGDIIGDDSLDEMVEHEARVNGWQRVKFLLGGIERINEDFYRINGYGNIENIEPGYTEAILSDMLDEVKQYYGL